MDLFTQIQEFLNDSAAEGKKPLLVLLGPTASGKTALGLMIAKKFNGEVISADSRQVYKGMDVGTEKILPHEQMGVPHHLLDIVNPDEDFTLPDFKRNCLKVISEIQKRQRLPILCGGTGLYINSVIENYQIPQVPPQYDYRQKLAEYASKFGNIALHDLLKERDPETALKIHPNNMRYVIRALEINEFGKTQKLDQKGEQLFNVISFGIDWPREILYERIDKRAASQIDRGVLEEVKALLNKGYDKNLPSMSSLGYLELIKYLEGSITLEEALLEIQKNTRNYAKRQLTWFRRYKNVNWIPHEEFMRYYDKYLSSH